MNSNELETNLKSTADAIRSKTNSEELMEVSEFPQSISGIETASNDVYSLDEIVVGTWIDNKPIYRKVFKLTTPATNGFEGHYLLAELNIDTITHIEGICIGKNGYCAPANTNSIETNPNYRCEVCIYARAYDKIDIHAYSSNYLSCPIYAILEYTKKTD